MAQPPEPLCRKSSDQTISKVVSSGTRFPTLVAKMVSLITACTSRRSSGWHQSMKQQLQPPDHLTVNLATKWREGKTLCVFVKCFTKFLKVKHFITFYKIFYN